MAAIARHRNCPCGRYRMLHRFIPLTEQERTGYYRHFDTCPNGCFGEDHGFGPWEVVRLHQGIRTDNLRRPIRGVDGLPIARQHHVVVLPLPAGECCQPPRRGRERMVPCLFITSNPCPDGPDRQKRLIGPTDDEQPVDITQIPWRPGDDLSLHPRVFLPAVESWLSIQRPQYWPLKQFHRLPWPAGIRAALDRESIDRVVGILSDISQVRLDPFSPFVSLDNASLAAGFRRKLFLCRSAVLRQAPHLSEAIDRGDTGLSLLSASALTSSNGRPPIAGSAAQLGAFTQGRIGGRRFGAAEEFQEECPSEARASEQPRDDEQSVGPKGQSTASSVWSLSWLRGYLPSVSCAGARK